MKPTITEIIKTIQANKKELGITLFDKASDFEIQLFEINKHLLPDDIKTFYSFCNGFYSNEDMFRIIPLAEIIKKERDTNIEGDHAFHIAEYMLYCGMWTLDIDPANKNNYTIYNKVETVVTLTNSFADFLDKFLTGGVFEGLYNWRAQILKDALPAAGTSQDHL